MEAREFWKLTREDEELLLLRCVEGLEPSGDYLDIQYIPTGGTTRISVSEILATDASDLVELLKFRRPARIMTHVTRDAQHWRFAHTMNGSMLAEVRDRRNGNYSVEETHAITS